MAAGTSRSSARDRSGVDDATEIGRQRSVSEIPLQGSSGIDCAANWERRKPVTIGKLVVWFTPAIRMPAVIGPLGRAAHTGALGSLERDRLDGSSVSWAWRVKPTCRGSSIRFAPEFGQARPQWAGPSASGNAWAPAQGGLPGGSQTLLKPLSIGR